MLFISLIDIIPDLLYKHNCVIIPDFGGFITNFKHSGFEESRNIINPSSKKVAFNQSLIENDGLLVSYCSKIKNITYQEAFEDVEKFSIFIKEKIFENKSFDFKNIGTFYLTSENTMLFVPYQGLNFLESSYGLYPVKIKSLNNIPLTSLNTEINEFKETEKVDISEDNSPIEVEEYSLKNYSTQINLNPFLKVASIIIIAFFIVFGLFYFDSGIKNKNQEQKAQLFNIDSNSGKNNTVKHKKVVVLEYTEERKKIEEIKTKLKTFNENQIPTNETYDVIVGYYMNYQEANKILSKLKNEFVNATMNKKSDSGYSITVETFYTHTTAEGFAVILKQNGYKNTSIEKNVVFRK